MMSGDIWVESEQDQGSTFHFTANFELQAGDGSRRLPVSTELGQLRILVVDDKSTAREIMTHMLNDFGFHVDQAQCGAEAIATLQQNDQSDPYELVLMDWKMPDIDGIEATKRIQNSHLINNVPTVILATAYGKEEATQAAAEVDISGFITKPVTASCLLDSILLAMGKETGTDNRATKEEVDVSAAIDKVRGAKLLLVEDNEINQELAMELLTRNDCKVTLAENGQRALEILAEQSNKHCFDGILMDCQMPVMDGYTATGHIRTQAKYKDLPIIAMTANVMAGDKEKVLACGMNDHIAKPINVAQMFNTIAKWVTPSEPVAAITDEHSLTNTQTQAAITIPPLDGIDIQSGLAVTQDNRQLYLKLLKRFVAANTDFAEEFEQARQTSQQQDSNEPADQSAATRCAHTLKGTAGNIGAFDVQHAARALEAACEQGKTDIDDLLAEVLKNLTVVLNGLSQLDSEQPSSVGGNKAGGIDKGQIAPLLTELKALVDDYDTQASDVLDKLAPLFNGTQLQGKFEPVIEAIDGYDFDTASEVIEQLEVYLSDAATA